MIFWSVEVSRRGSIWSRPARLSDHVLCLSVSTRNHSTGEIINVTRDWTEIRVHLMPAADLLAHGAAPAAASRAGRLCFWQTYVGWLRRRRQTEVKVKEEKKWESRMKSLMRRNFIVSFKKNILIIFPFNHFIDFETNSFIIPLYLLCLLQIHLFCTELSIQNSRKWKTSDFFQSDYKIIFFWCLFKSEINKTKESYPFFSPLFTTLLKKKILLFDAMLRNGPKQDSMNTLLWVFSPVWQRH